MRSTILLLFIVLLISSCNKDEVQTPAVASLNLVNAVVGGTSVRQGSIVSAVANNSSARLAMLAGQNDLYVWPVGDSLNPYFVYNKLAITDRANYSLFVCGAPGNTEGVLIKEDLPYRTDSTIGIRFINLAPNSTPLNITLSTSNTVQEVSSLAYKQYTQFKTFPGLYNSSYIFQVRDANSAAPATPKATFSLSATQIPRFSNFTLVIRQNGTSGFAVFRVNDQR